MAPFRPRVLPTPSRLPANPAARARTPRPVSTWDAVRAGIRAPCRGSHRKRRAAAGPILARATAWTPLFISPNPSSSCRAPTVRSSIADFVAAPNEPLRVRATSASDLPSGGAGTLFAHPLWLRTYGAENLLAVEGGRRGWFSSAAATSFAILGGCSRSSPPASISSPSGCCGCRASALSRPAVSLCVAIHACPCRG